MSSVIRSFERFTSITSVFWAKIRIIHKKLAFLLFNDHNWVPLTKHLTLSNSEYKFGKNFKHIINSEEVAAEPLWCTFCKITKFKDMDI